MISPSSTAGSSASCCALLKRWISSRKRIVRPPVPPSRSRARVITPRTSPTEAETADSSSNSAPVVSATIRASVVFPVPGGPYRIIEPTRSASIASRSAECGPRMCCWPTNSSSVRGRRRIASGATSGSRSRMASAKRSPMTEKVCSARWPRQPRRSSGRSMSSTSTSATWRARRPSTATCSASRSRATTTGRKPRSAELASRSTTRMRGSASSRRERFT